MLIIIMVLAALNAQPPVQAARFGGAAQVRELELSISGVSPQVAAAGGLSPAQAHDFVQALLQHPVLEGMLAAQEAGNGPGPGQGTRVAGSREGQFRVAAKRARDQALLAAGVPRATLAKVETCAAAEAAGLPASMGLVCATPAQRAELARALSAERRAGRLGRPLAARHQVLLERVRSDPAFQAATARVESESNSIRQALSQ
jgi:hypothetical protein